MKNQRLKVTIDSVIKKLTQIDHRIEKMLKMRDEWVKLYGTLEQLQKEALERHQAILGETK